MSRPGGIIRIDTRGISPESHMSCSRLLLAVFSRRTQLVALAGTVTSALLLAPAGVQAQSGASTPAARFVDSARVEIDRAVASHDAPRLAAAVVLLDRALVAFPDDPYLLHYRGYAAYRQAVDVFRAKGAEGMGTAAPILARGVADLERSSARLAWPESFALLAALTGFQIAADPSLGAELGMKIGMLQGRASSLGASNPRVLLLQAQGAANTPPEYGGGVEQARALLARALKAFETDAPKPLAPAWGREEALGYQAMLK
jgi:hypothetical protein